MPGQVVKPLLSSESVDLWPTPFSHGHCYRTVSGLLLVVSGEKQKGRNGHAHVLVLGDGHVGWVPVNHVTGDL